MCWCTRNSTKTVEKRSAEDMKVGESSSVVVRREGVFSIGHEDAVTASSQHESGNRSAIKGKRERKKIGSYVPA